MRLFSVDFSFFCYAPTFYEEISGYITNRCFIPSSWSQGFVISEDRANPCSDDGHDGAAATATHGRSLSEPCQCAIGVKLADELNNLYQLLAVGVQESKVPCAPEPSRQHML